MKDLTPLPSVKVLSSDRENRTVASVGASYYPMMNRVGLDVGVGRTFENGAATVSWDVINSAPQASIGFVDTVKQGSGPGSHLLIRSSSVPS